MTASPGPATSQKSVLWLLWAFAFLSYLLRTNIATAQQSMALELSLSDVQIGYVFSAFLIGYTIFQVPAGMLGDRWGPRLVLGISVLGWGLTTLLSGLLPGLLVKGTTAVLFSLLVVRFLHGTLESATYPVAMTAVADWFSQKEHAFINSLIFTGSTLGSAFAPPLVAYLMTRAGWRATFYVTAVLPVVAELLWWRQTRGRQHRRNEKTPDRRAGWRGLTRRGDLFALCFSYFLYCYAISIFVYWLYKYLVDVRHLSLMNSGWAASAPWIFASITVPLFGYLSGRLSEQLGLLRARRLVAAVCLCLAACLMFVGAGAENITIAVTAIVLSVGLLFSTESSYWSTAIYLAQEDAGSASGLMNLAGNLGGVTSTMLVPILAHSFGWFNALLSGSAMAIAGATCWFLIQEKTGPDSHSQKF